jgi:hypothetical protein
VVEFVATRVLVGPLADGLEHVAMNLDAFIAQGRMMKGAEAVIHDFINGDVGVFPGEEDAAEMVSD